MQTSTNLVRVLLDSDSLYFRICCTTKNKKEIRKRIKISMQSIKNELEVWDEELEFHVAIKGKGNYRDRISPHYKGKRPALEDDMKEALAYSIQHMIDEYGAIPADDMEADDLCAIWAYESREEGIPYFIVGIDKDLLQIPGNHYNFVKGEHTFIDDDEGWYRLMLQCLTGDRVDNIPGIKGVGPKKAEIALRPLYGDREGLWNKVVEMWGDDKEQLEISYNLLRMLTNWEEYDEIRAQFPDETTVSECNVGSKGKEDVQEQGVSGVSE